MNTNDNTNPILDNGSVIQAGGTDINVGIRATPIANDWNEDGKKDLLIGNLDGNIIIYLNEGSNSLPVFNSSYLLETGGRFFDIGSRAAPRIHDWNKDGLKDILIGELEGYVYFLKNVGTNDAPVFDRAEKLLLLNGNFLRYPDRGPRSRLYISDWNNDGHNDVLLGGIDGKVMIFLASTVSSYSLPEHLNKTLNLSIETLLKLKKMIKLHTKSLKNRLLN